MMASGDAPRRLAGPNPARLILASASAARAAMLTQAGVVFEQMPARVDEEAIKAALRAEGADGHTLADRLAEMKALRVSAGHPDAFVLGADQVLVQDGDWFDKPADRAAAQAALARLSGHPHTLVSAAVIVRDGARIWGHADHTEMYMRALSDDFIDQYLDAAGDAVLGSVGCYQIEGLGAHLFERIDGDWFTILGLPLLPLLAYLRGHGLVPA